MPHAEALRELQRRAEMMTRGDFRSLGQPIGGPCEIEDLRRAIDVMGTHIAQAQTDMQEYIAVLTTAQEAERGRIARELHDDTVQRLVALGQGIERAQRSLDRDPARASARLRALRAETTALIQAVRAVISDLRPPALEELGLLPAFEVLIQRSRTEPPEVTVVVQGTERRLDPQSELALFRILQEAWTNIRQHADARRAYFGFTYGTDALHVTVADDGRGFTPPINGRVERGRWGILGMQERAGLVGGNLSISSWPGHGTRIEVHIPYPGVNSRDPICGMEVGPDALRAEHDGVLYRFCSAACRDLFLAQPDRYDWS